MMGMCPFDTAPKESRILVKARQRQEGWPATPEQAPDRGFIPGRRARQPADIGL